MTSKFSEDFFWSSPQIDKKIEDCNQILQKSFCFGRNKNTFVDDVGFPSTYSFSTATLLNLFNSNSPYYTRDIWPTHFTRGGKEKMPPI